MSTAEPGPLLRSLAPAPAAIEALSIARLEAEAGPLPWSGDERRLALRLAYAVGDPTILSDLEFATGALPSGLAALAAGRSLFVDVRMAASGVDRHTADMLGVAVRCLLDAPGIAAAAAERNITRSAQAVLALADELSGAVVAIGNAPTALLALLDLIDAGIATPALVLGFPVGYVAAAEAKAELCKRQVPYITLRGHRGGTPLAVSAVNTLLRMAAERQTVPRNAAWPDAVLLVGHGSREPDAARAMERVMAELASRGPIAIVEPGFVQLVSPTIPEGVGRCVLQGARNIVAVPYFLHEGKHVLRDLPALLRQAIEEYPGTRICLAEPIGSHPALTDIVQERALHGPFIGDVLEAADTLGAAGYVMSSAPFVYRADGRPDWTGMWQAFCELALFGGPPHRGPDNPVSHREVRSAVSADGDAVIAELQRGIYETTGLRAEPAEAGWLSLRCTNERMAAWMSATIILENVDARCDGDLLYVPVHPSFTLENEVKSVVTVVAKTHHYWAAGHRPTEPVPPRDRGRRL